jgi:hypothetical protein
MPNMITVANATRYSINKATEMAYEIEYSDGTKVRAVQSKGHVFRKEYSRGGAWVQSGKAYVVNHSKKRQAEQIKQTVEAHLAA